VIRRGKVPDIPDARADELLCCSSGYQSTRKTCKRTCGNETKAYPTIRTPTHGTNWGLNKGLATVFQTPTLT